jgi:hypothetical protein
MVAGIDGCVVMGGIPRIGVVALSSVGVRH